MFQSVSHIYIILTTYCDSKAAFSPVITPVFSVTLSLRNIKMNILLRNIRIIIIINVEDSCAA